MSLVTKALLPLALVAATAAHAQDRRVTIVNNTGYTMTKFTSTNSGARNWGRDVLGQYTLPSGSSFNLNFDNKYGYCLFDFKATFEDGDVLTRANVNVCKISTYTYNP